MRYSKADRESTNVEIRLPPVVEDALKRATQSDAPNPAKNASKGLSKAREKMQEASGDVFSQKAARNKLGAPGPIGTQGGPTAGDKFNGGNPAVDSGIGQNAKKGTQGGTKPVKKFPPFPPQKYAKGSANVKSPYKLGMLKGC